MSFCHYTFSILLLCSTHFHTPFIKYLNWWSFKQFTVWLKAWICKSRNFLDCVTEAFLFILEVPNVSMYFFYALHISMLHFLNYKKNNNKGTRNWNKKKKNRTHNLFSFIIFSSCAVFRLFKLFHEKRTLKKKRSTKIHICCHNTLLSPVAHVGTFCRHDVGRTVHLA